jgi:enterochelin esterase-like enzyme
MTIRRWLQITLTAMIIFVSLVGLSYGSKMVTHDINSSSLAKNIVGWSSLRHILVYLPDGYESNNYNYPVIYWIPRWAGSATDQYQRALDDAIRSRRIPATIAVFIDVHEGILFLNSSVFGNGEDFLVKELISFIDRTYRAIPDKNSRCIAGHSAGGFSAVQLPILNPGIWGAVGTNDGMEGYPWYQIVGKEEITDSIPFKDGAIK